jgi:hypothetical protein
MGLISLRETYQTVSPYSSMVHLRNGRCQASLHSQPIDSRIGIRTGPVRRPARTAGRDRPTPATSPSWDQRVPVILCLPSASPAEATTSQMGPTMPG